MFRCERFLLGRAQAEESYQLILFAPDRRPAPYWGTFSTNSIGGYIRPCKRFLGLGAMGIPAGGRTAELGVVLGGFWGVSWGCRRLSGLAGSASEFL